MLTERALYERRWGPFPFLGPVVQPLLQQFEDSHYPTSISETELDSIRSVLSTSALVRAHPSALRDAVRAGTDTQDRMRRAEALYRGLKHLQEWLGRVESTAREQRAGLVKMTHELMRDIERDLSSDRDFTTE